MAQLKTPDQKLQAMYEVMKIRPTWIYRAEQAARKVLLNKDRYKKVEALTTVPWDLIGCLHLMESGCNFNAHMHNGDPLKYRTTRVPRGRPLAGKPPFTWEESAIDAIAYDKLAAKGPFTSMGKKLDAAERYNGLGYRIRGVPSPYIWSGSDQYIRGKYTSDGKYDPSAVSAQVGVAVVLNAMLKLLQKIT